MSVSSGNDVSLTSSGIDVRITSFEEACPGKLLYFLIVLEKNRLRLNIASLKDINSVILMSNMTVKYDCQI
jgi:hypothetical protein